MSGKFPPISYDIWEYPFQYEEKPWIRKKRPVVIIIRNNNTDVVLGIKVTTKETRKGYLGEVKLQDWDKEGLTKESTVRCSKRATIPISAFENAKYYGQLTERDARAVEEALIKLGVINPSL